MKYTPPLGSADPDAPFVDGNPTAGIRGSVVPAAVFNQVQQELLNVIQTAGLEPDAADLRQLAAAIAKLIASGAAAPQHGHSAADITSGTLPVGRGGTGAASTAQARTNLGAASSAVTITAGNGLSGGGNLTANRTLAVKYGITAGTACQGNDARLVGSEAFRQALIGAPMYLPTTTLPDGFMWADGSLAKFADWPELQAKYNAGGFAGMVLAYNASDSDKAAYPGKWVPNAANPTGLFLPRLGNLFFRNWVGGTGNAGAYNAPGLPNIMGSFHTGGGANDSFTGAFYQQNIIFDMGQHPSAINSNLSNIAFDASRSNHMFGLSTTVMPPSIDSPISIYLGNHT